MKLAEVFSQLAHGELSPFNMGGSEDIGIQPVDYHKVIPHINLTLNVLFTRFSLRRQEVVVQQFDEIQRYFLNSDYAQTNSQSTAYKKYIMDSVYQPFTDNVLKIEKVINEDGQELYTNDTGEYWSVTIPEYNVVQVPYPEKENQMIVTYRASHDPIKLANLDPNTQNVDISPAMLEPFLFYIAARLHSNTTAEDLEKSSVFMNKYEMACSRIEDVGIPQKDATKNDRLESLGWV